MFKDNVFLLLSIIRNYNRYITSVEEAEKSTGVFIQYSSLKKIMEESGQRFTVATEPMFGRFKFVSISFPLSFKDELPFLASVGFVEKDGQFTLLLSESSKMRFGVAGEGACSEWRNVLPSFEDGK